MMSGSIGCRRKIPSTQIKEDNVLAQALKREDSSGTRAGVQII
jgi:hypothetical protein